MIKQFKIPFKMNSKMVSRTKALCSLTLAAGMLVLPLIPGNTVLAAENAAVPGNGDKVSALVSADVEKRINEKKVMGAVVTIVQDGRVLLSKGYGYADEQNKIPADPASTAFRIGSVSKTFVALAAMQLVEKGQLDMDVPVSRYLGSDFPALQYPVTMRNLLTHSAGFEDISSGLFIQQGKTPLSLKDTLIKYRPQQVYRPGDVFAYSNYGLSLAGYVIEKISGQSYADYAEQNIFKPLSMRYSTYDPISPKAPLVSRGYAENGSERAESLVQFYPCGSITATAEDMGKYMNLMLSQTDSPLITNNMKQEVFKRQFTVDDTFDGIGYSWGRYTRNGHIVHSHEGGTQNFSTIILLCPDQKLGVFVSFNTPADMHEIPESIMNSLYGPEDTSKYSQPYSSSESQDISGYYTSTVSNRTTAEKFIAVESTIHIGGDASKGFTYNNAPLQHIGVNAFYHPDLGYLKFIKKNGQSFLVSSECYSFVRVPWYEGAEWQEFVLVFYALASLCILFVSIILFINGIKKRNGWIAVMSIPGILVFGAFIYTIIQTFLFISNLEYAGVAEFVTLLKASGRAMFITGCATVVSSIYFWMLKKNWLIRLSFMLWTASFICLTFWLWGMNLLR